MKDYKDLSFNQIVDLVGNLYKEIDRLTAERNAFERMSQNVKIDYSTLAQIKATVKEAITEQKKSWLSFLKTKKAK